MSPSPYLYDAPTRKKLVLTSTLLRKIQRVCDPSLKSFNKEAGLEVAKYINERGEDAVAIAAAARDAVTIIVKLVNCRDIQASIHALRLLDVLVRECGFVIHFEISRREFLNALVKKFPEQPPLRYTNVQKLILTLIETWYQSICKYTYYKSDLVYIRDMHRLLKFKGYIFPRLKEEDLSKALKPVRVLRTYRELRHEQEIRQSLQLDELILKGGAENLKKANKLMKVMAGFTDDNKREVRNIVRDELMALKEQLNMLDDMVRSIKCSDLSTSVPQQATTTKVRDLLFVLQSAQEKIPIIIREEEQEENGGEDKELIQDLKDFNERLKSVLSSVDSSTFQICDTGKVAQNSAPDHFSEEILLDFETSSDGHTVKSPTNKTTTARAEPDLIDQPVLADISKHSHNVVQTGFNFGSGISLKSSKPINPIVTMSFARDHNTDIFGRHKFSGSGQLELTDQAVGFQSDTSRILLLGDGPLKIEYIIHRDRSSELVSLDVYFSSETNTAITNVEFSLAVPKGFSLQLYPQSGTSLEPFGKDSIVQHAIITSQIPRHRKHLRVKWKVTYQVDGTELVEKSGVSTLLDVQV